MVAGATGSTCSCSSWTPARVEQTREHAEILRLLGVEAGVVAVTKVDAVDDGRIAAAVAEAGELVPGAEVVRVSATSGEGLSELRAALARAAARARPVARDLPTRLWIDRVFSLAGVGTVVTGTLWSGSIGAGDELRVEPGALDGRVRSVEVHDERVRAGRGRAASGGRAGRSRAECLRRGQALVEPGAFPVGFRLDVRLDGDDFAPTSTVHIGTAAIPARIVRDGNYGQLRLSEAVVAARGDRIVLRTRTTIGGGVVLDPAPPRGLDPSAWRSWTEVMRKRSSDILRASRRRRTLCGREGSSRPPSSSRGSPVSRRRTTSITGPNGSSPAAAAQRLTEQAAATPSTRACPSPSCFPASPGALRSSGSSTSRSATGARTFRDPPRAR